jgi:hypothetical protein
MGENARDEAQWFPNALELHLCESCECSEPWLERQKNNRLNPQDTIRKVLKLKCLEFPYIVDLGIICVNYDKKKGWESNWEFDSRPQISWKHGSNEVQLELAIHHWKDILKGYKILSSNFFQKTWFEKDMSIQNFGTTII